MAVAQIAISSCIELRSNPGFYLRSDAAKAWDRATAAFGKIVIITGAWRSYGTQERLFDGEKFPNQDPQYGRYLRGNRAGQSGFSNDVRWWPAKGSYWTRKSNSAAAAVPGTSNHGGGISVDAKTRREKGDPSYDTHVVFTSFSDPDRLRFLRVAAEHGWDDDEGRGINEPWHLTYYADRDQHRGEAVPAPPKKEEGFLMALNDEEQKAVLNRVNQIKEQQDRIEQQNATRHAASFQRERATLAEVTALSAGMKALAEARGVDGADLVRAVKSAATAALKDLTITLTTEAPQ